MKAEVRPSPALLTCGHSGPAWNIQGQGTHYLMVKSFQVHGLSLKITCFGESQRAATYTSPQPVPEAGILIRHRALSHCAPWWPQDRSSLVYTNSNLNFTVAVPHPPARPTPKRQCEAHRSLQSIPFLPHSLLTPHSTKFCLMLCWIHDMKCQQFSGITGNL